MSGPRITRTGTGRLRPRRSTRLRWPTMPEPAAGRRRWRRPATGWRSWRGARADMSTPGGCGGPPRAWSTSRPTSRRYGAAARYRREVRPSPRAVTPRTSTSPTRRWFACGATRQARVLVNRLRGSQYDGAVPADGLSSPGAESAADPAVAMTEYGQGFVTSQRRDLEQRGARSSSAATARLRQRAPDQQPRPGSHRRIRFRRSPGCSPIWSPGSRIRVAPGRRRSGFGTSRGPRRSAPSRSRCRIQPGSDGRRPRAGGRRRRGWGRGDRLGAGQRRVDEDRRRPAVRTARSGGTGQVARLLPAPLTRSSGGHRPARGGDRSPTP